MMDHAETPSTCTQYHDPDIFRKQCQVEMLEDLNLDCILPHLVTAELLTSTELEHLSNRLFTTQSRILNLTRILSSKGEFCVPKFIECLEKATAHMGHVTLLEKIQSKLNGSSNSQPSTASSSDSVPEAPEQSKSDYEGPPNYCGLGVKRKLTNDSGGIPSSKRSATGDLLQRHSIHEMCVKDIDLEALIPHLNNQDLLTASEEEHLVNAQLMKNVRIDALLRFISMRDGGFDKFVTAVGREKSHSGHQSLYTAFNSDWLEVDGLQLHSETYERHQMKVNLTATKQFIPSEIRIPGAQSMSNPQLILFIEEYEHYLRKYYKSKDVLEDPGKWRPTTTKKYINLALIEKGEVNKTEADKYTQATIHGDIDDIMKQKKHMELREVALPSCEDGSIPKFILVEGAPGVGKTTFSWELSKQWGNRTILQQFRLVILLRLREKRVQEMKSISDIFFYSNLDVQQHVAREVEQTHGKGVLLILEGFDELPSAKRDNEFILYRILTGELLPEASILVTTRHSASDFLFQHFPEPNQHIEIVGFTKENIASYYESVMRRGTREFNAFKQYLKLYPHIHSAMYVPLHCAFVVEVYMNSFRSKTTDESRSAVPKTITQLYYSLAKCLLLRYLKAHKKYSKRSYHIRTFSDLPKKVLKQLHVISKLAYDGLLKDKVIFTDSDVPQHFDTLELMQAIPELYIDEGTVVSYNFIHLTLQEFLAACYLHSLDSAMWIKEFQRFKNSERMKTMLRFLAGLTGLNGMRRKTIRELIFLDNTKVDREITVDGLHWLFEAQFEEISFTASVLGSSEVKIDCTWSTVSQFDCFVLGYCIARSKCKWKLGLCECDIGDDGLLVLADSIQANKDTCFDVGYISALRLRGNGISSMAFSYLLQETPQSLFTELKELELGNNKINSEACGVIAQQIMFMPKLETVSLSGNRLGRGGAIKLLQAMLTLQSRKLLSLFNTKVGTEETNLVAELLEKPPGCEVVYLGGTAVTTETAERILRSLLSDSSSVRELYIAGAEFTSNTIYLLAEVLRKNNKLEVIDLRYCGIDKHGGKAILEALCENTTLKDIMITKGNFLDAVEAAAINSRFPQEDSCSPAHDHGYT